MLDVSIESIKSSSPYESRGGDTIEEKNFPLMSPPISSNIEKPKQQCKKFLPIWFDPQVEPKHVLLSWYIPILWPEQPEEGEEQVRVNAIRLGSAKLPKAMFKNEVAEFLDTEDGKAWYEEQCDIGQEKLKEKARKCSKCGYIIVPRMKAKKYISECPGCHRFADFVRL